MADPEMLADLEEHPKADAAVSVYQPAPIGTISGDTSLAALRLPRLHIAYGVGNLAKVFNPGDLVLGDDTLLVAKGQPLKVIIIRGTEYWKEYYSQKMRETKAAPRTFRTEAEVHAAGGTTAWIDNVGPSFSKALDLDLLIEKPAALVSGLFGLRVGDRVFAPARWTVDKTAYRRISKDVMYSATFALRERGLLSGTFEIQTTTAEINGNATIVPSIRLVSHNTNEEVAEIKRLLGGSAD